MGGRSGGGAEGWAAMALGWGRMGTREGGAADLGGRRGGEGGGGAPVDEGGVGVELEGVGGAGGVEEDEEGVHDLGVGHDGRHRLPPGARRRNAARLG
jgi:hypothetical protein